MQFRLICKTPAKINAIKTLRVMMEGWNLVTARDAVINGLVFDSSKELGEFLEMFRQTWEVQRFFVMAGDYPTWEVVPHVEKIAPRTFQCRVAEAA